MVVEGMEIQVSHTHVARYYCDRISLAGAPQYVPLGVDRFEMVVYDAALVVSSLIGEALAAPARDTEFLLQYSSRRLPPSGQYLQGGTKQRWPRVLLRYATVVDTLFVPNASGTTTWTADTGIRIDVTFILSPAEACDEAYVLRVSGDT